MDLIKNTKIPFSIKIDENANVSYNGKVMLDGSHNNMVCGKNGSGTATVLSNEGLSQDIDDFTSLVDLKDFSGRSLAISENRQLSFKAR